MKEKTYNNIQNKQNKTAGAVAKEQCKIKKLKPAYIFSSEGDIVNIIYNDIKKDLSCEELHRLFVLVGWSDGSDTLDMIKYYNVPFINSTLVISAFENDRLVGAVRVISDKTFRSVIYDLLVDPEFQGKGIGKELVKQCMQHFPDSEWLVQTKENISGFYEKIGFKINNDVFLTIPSKLFTLNA